MQKTAYRRANGGSGAPGIHEDVAPKFVSTEVSDWKEMTAVVGDCFVMTRLVDEANERELLDSQVIRVETGRLQERLLAAKEPKLVVRKTFLDLEATSVEGSGMSG